MIPEFKLNIEPVTEEAKETIGFEHAPIDIGTRSKVGGRPEFIQDEEKPYCLNCKKPLQFYAQLDSIGDKVMFGDCGMMYLFVCFECQEGKAIIQSM